MEFIVLCAMLLCRWLGDALLKNIAVRPHRGTYRRPAGLTFRS